MSEQLLLDYWKPVKGYEGLYEVSVAGQVRSVARTVSHKYYGCQKFKSIMRRLSQNTRGYFVVQLSGRDKKKRRFAVHRLVETTFRPDKQGRCVRHLDGHKLNNRLSNLATGTHAENSADTIRHGRMMNGENHTHHKLSESDIPKIRECFGFMSDAKIGSKFNVGGMAIWKIRHGITWKQVR
jgi:hypothetical protein